MIKRDALLLLPRDDRDLRLSAITELPKLSELPEEFELNGYIIKDQKQTDFCTQFAVCGASELQEGVELCPEWTFAVSKSISGDLAFEGQDIRTALKVHTKNGAVEAKQCSFSVKDHEKEFLRDISNYPESLRLLAITHLKKSYVAVDGPYDTFDNIKATIWKYRKEKRAVVSGVQYDWGKYDVIFEKATGKGGGHCMTYMGWKKINKIEYLKVANSYGKKAGENGFHYVSREVVNRYASLYGAFTFLDMDPETIRYMQEHGITDKDNWLVQLMKVAVSLLKQLIEVKKTSPK